MARNTHKGKSTSSKLTKGYLATLWVTGIVLFLFFAFAIFCACGGLDLITEPATPPTQFMVDENGEYYFIDENGEKQYVDLDELLSGTDLSPTDTVTSPADVQ